MVTVRIAVAGGGASASGAASLGLLRWRADCSTPLAVTGAFAAARVTSGAEAIASGRPRNGLSVVIAQAVARTAARAPAPIAIREAEMRSPRFRGLVCRPRGALNSSIVMGMLANRELSLAAQI
jgi:hypothetical protein